LCRFAVAAPSEGVLSPEAMLTGDAEI
jgi:hypothetical protein